MAETQAPQNTPAQDALSEWVDKRFKALARGRWAEEREWFQAGMFDQLKQWLENGKGPDAKKLMPIKADDKTKFPMPVSNHFSKAIARNANMLGAAIPEMLAQPDNYDSRNRRAAEAAENALDAANRESGMNVLNPILAKRTTLWGLGITKDVVAFDHSTDEVPQMEQPPPTQGPDGPVEQDPQAVGTQRIPSPRLKTELPSIFNVYLPRDCQDANLSKIVIERVPMDLGEARELYPDFAEVLKKDEGEEGDSLAQYFLNSLRSLAYTAKDAEGDDKVKLTECWVDWSSLSKDVQDKIEEEWDPEPSTIYQKVGLSKLEAAIQYGIFVVQWGKLVLEWGENPWDGDVPYTFFPWQKDVASVYPKGLSTELIPLQKQLNRLDSLMERSLLSNASVKLLWPTSQNTPAPTGDPVEITYWDPIGDGKVKPEFFGGKAYGAELMQKRQQIVADMDELSLSNQASEGESPGAGTAFRALAFMASKAEETRKTQVFLCEASHEMRARKVIKMARKVWSTPRKIQTAGFNNRYGAQQIEASDLEGDFELNVIQDSSRPKTLSEKLQAYQMLVTGGVVNAQDPANREYITDTLGVSDINLSDHLEFVKAERDLEAVKTGIQPQTNPFMKYPIHFTIFTDYIQTEEYEGLDPEIKAGVMAYAQWLQEMAAPPPIPGPPGGPPGPPPGPNGIGGQTPGHVLHQVPGQGVAPAQVQAAAEKEGFDSIPNSPATG